MKPIALPAGLETETFLLGEDALRQIPALLKRHWNHAAGVWLVADGNTWTAAGEKLKEILKAAGFHLPEPFLFPDDPAPHAEESNVDALLAAYPAGTVPVAVGSGTINDLVKRMAGVAKVRYLCVPTAASVDGYTSYGAALQSGGFKQTLPCPAPLAIAADTTVLHGAPPEMLAAGYADLMSKIPAGADWILADCLGLDPIRPDVWELVQKPLRGYLADPADVEQVFLGLAATGYAMQMCRDSRPASGAEHLMSHIWEMEGLEFGGQPVSHGFKVAIGTVAVTKLYEALFRLSVDQARTLAEPGPSPADRDAEIRELLRQGCYGDQSARVAMEKFMTGGDLQRRREQLYANWETLRDKIGRQMYPLQTLTTMLLRANCPTQPGEIGLSAEQYRHGIRAAQLIRHRYTVLDAVYELGLMNQLAGQM